MKITITSDDQARRCRIGIVYRAKEIIKLMGYAEFQDDLRLRSVKTAAHTLHQMAIALITWEKDKKT